MMYRSLLVPLDGSPFGEQALPLAVSVARRAAATLEVAHVHTPFTYYRVPWTTAPALDEQAQQDRRAYLEDIVQRLTAEAQVAAAATLLVGKTADALHNHAVAKGTDLVVMTTQGCAR